MDEAQGIYRGEVRAIMLGLVYANEKLDALLEYVEEDDDEEEEEEEPPHA